MNADASQMRALAVHPGSPGSLHARSVRRPAIDDIPDGRGVLVQLLRVGLDGTDKEIIAAEYGQAPEGDDFLIIGHESLGRVVETGADAPPNLQPGALVVATVRRPGSSPYDAIGSQDFTTDDVYFERGINLRHGYLAEYYVEDAAYLVQLPETLARVGVLLEPLAVAEKGINQAFEIQRRLRIWRPRRAAVTGAGPIGLLAAMALRLRGLEVTVYSRRPAPYLNSELVEAINGRYVSSTDATLDEAARDHGPFDIIFEASGASAVIVEAMTAVGRNGVLVLSGVTGGDHTHAVHVDTLNQAFVLGNRVMVGTVNASRDDFVRGVHDLVHAEAQHPGWLERLLTTPITGLDDPAAVLHHLTDDHDAIKVFVEVGA